MIRIHSWIPVRQRTNPPWRTFIAGMTILVSHLGFPSQVSANANDSLARHEWVLNTEYQGVHPELFNKLKWTVPNLIRQTMIDVAVRLGLDFNEGWRYPLSVGFVDSAPMGVENALAYTMLLTDGKDFAQVLNINLTAYEKISFQYEKVLAHELVHAMLNDAVGAEAAMVFPVWLHEGLAVYGADQGETMVTSYAQQLYGVDEEDFLNGLEGPHGALDYAEDYLAIKYIVAEHGKNALHNFVKEVIRRGGDVPGALQYTCFEKWNDFKENARQYAIKEIKAIGPARRDGIEQPY